MEKEEIKELIRNAKNGSEEAMEQLVTQNVKLIQHVANKYKHTIHDPDDLFQLASIGFIKAVHQFDLEANTKLVTYAFPKLHNEINNFLREDSTIKVPRPIQRTERLIFRNDCFDKTVEEISKIIGVTDLDLIQQTIDHIHRGRVLSLSGVVWGKDGHDEITLEDMVIGEEGSFWDNNLILQDAVSRLDEREQKIIQMRFKGDMSQREVAKVIGVSQVQVSRLERMAMAKIREYMGAPLELPKVEKKPKVVKPKTGPRKPQGDREKAINLLRTSTLNYTDISEMTGVPIGTMYKLGREHRPKELRDIVKKRHTHEKGELNVYEA